MITLRVCLSETGAREVVKHLADRLRSALDVQLNEPMPGVQSTRQQGDQTEPASLVQMITVVQLNEPAPGATVQASPREDAAIKDAVLVVRSISLLT